MSATLKEIEKCETLLKEIEDKWAYQDSIGYSRDSYDAGLYCKILEKIARLKWVDAGLANTMPNDTDLFNWGKEQVAQKKYTIPRQPNSNQSYLNIGVVDFQQLKKDYWAYYGKCD